MRMLAHLTELLKRGLRASLKPVTATGARRRSGLYPKEPPITGLREFDGYEIIPTVSSGPRKFNSDRWKR